jgi:hypothetical protein
MIGPEVTELLPELTLAQMMELTPAEIARNVHAHPTISEAIMEAACHAKARGQYAIHMRPLNRQPCLPQRKTSRLCIKSSRPLRPTPSPIRT